MSDEPKPQYGSIIFNDKPVALSPIPLPVVYFDGAPSLSHLHGIIGITLTVTGNVPAGAEGIHMCASVVAHLKCNIPAARALKSALEDALLLARPAEVGGEGKAN